MWDFILSDEEDQDALPVTTISRNQLDPPQSSAKKKNQSSTPTDKIVGKKSSPKATETNPVQSNSTTPSKILIISDEMEYSIIEDMKKTRANITFHELSKLKHQQKLLLKEMHAVPIVPLPATVISQATYEMIRPSTAMSNKVNPNDITLIGGRSKSHTLPFLLTFESFNKKFHNCQVDFGASSNTFPKIVCTKLNVQPQKSIVRIVQLDRSQVKIIGELNQVTIRISSNPKVCQVIGILVTYIPEFYGLILSKDWSEKLDVYFATHWSHMWLPYNGKPNQIKIEREKHQNYIVMELEGEKNL